MVFGLEPFQARYTEALRQALFAPYSVPGYRTPVPLAKFQMAPIPDVLRVQKEGTQICIPE